MNICDVYLHHDNNRLSMLMNMSVNLFGLRSSCCCRAMDLLLPKDTLTHCCEYVMLLLHEYAYINPIADLDRWSWGWWSVSAKLCSI